MKIIHCADIHLDSSMSSGLTAVQAQKRREEILDTFEEMLVYAKDNSVRAVIIAGDLFDGKNISKQTFDKVCSLFEEHSEIDFLYVNGNHDSNDAVFKNVNIKNLKLFSGDGGSYRYGNVVITGINNHSISDKLVLQENDVNIVAMHVMADEKFLRKLENKNIDYLALGHIHKRSEGRIDMRGCWAYSGCLEARGFDECNETGFYLLDINGNKTEFSFVPFGKRRAWLISIALQNEDIAGLYNIIDAAVQKKAEEKDLLKIEIKGEIPEGAVINTSYLERKLQEKYYLVRVVDMTRQVRTGRTDNCVSLRGIFNRLVMESDEPQELKDELIKCGEEAFDAY